jgi:voltage-gated potassium channel
LRELVEFYLIDYRTPLGRSIDITIIFMNLLVCAIFVIDTYNISEGLRTFLWRLEIFAVAFFIVEYVARLYGAPKRREQLLDVYSVIDLVAIFPTLFQAVLPAFGLSLNIAFVKTIRVFKVFRIFRFLRFLTDPNFFFGSVSLEFLKVARLVTTILIIFFISSGLFFYVEYPMNDQVQNFGDAFYFTVVALTTVGFGDITPVTEAGPDDPLGDHPHTLGGEPDRQRVDFDIQEDEHPLSPVRPRRARYRRRLLQAVRPLPLP